MIHFFDSDVHDFHTMWFSLHAIKGLVMQHLLKECSFSVSGIFFQASDTYLANFDSYEPV